MRKEAEERLKQAELNLKLFPNSKEYLRDLGDALHTLGHFAEHDHDFDLALALHQRSLKAFSQSGLKTRESWDDGVEHAHEHLFMDNFDKGILAQQQGNFLDSVSLLGKAILNFIDYPKIFNRLGTGGRVGKRMQSFVQKQSDEVKADVRTYIELASKTPVGSCQRLFL